MIEQQEKQMARTYNQNESLENLWISRPAMLRYLVYDEIMEREQTICVILIQVAEDI